MRKLSIAILFAMFFLVGCTRHTGKWEDGSSSLFPTDDHYILDTGEDCGSVNKSDDDASYSSFVRGHNSGQWQKLSQAKTAVQEDWECVL